MTIFERNFWLRNLVTFQEARLGKMEFAGIFHPVRGRGRRPRNK